MTKDELKGYLQTVLNVVKTLQSFVPQLAVVATAIEGILASDWLLTVAAWIITQIIGGKKFSEADLLDQMSLAMDADPTCDPALKAKLKAEAPALKLKLGK